MEFSALLGLDVVWCILAAITALLYLRHVLSFSNMSVFVALLSPSLLLLMPSGSVFSIDSPQEIMILSWFCELLVFSGCKMLMGLLANFNPLQSPIYATIIALSLIGAIFAFFKPELLEQLSPSLTEQDVYLVSALVPFILAVWKSLKTVIPVFLWGSGVVIALLFLANVQNYDLTKSHIQSTLEDGLATLQDNVLGKKEILLAYLME